MSTIKQLNITKTPPNPTVRRPNIMRKATTPRAKNTQQMPNSIPKLLANTVIRLTLRANSKNKSRGPIQIGPFSFPEHLEYRGGFLLSRQGKIGAVCKVSVAALAQHCTIARDRVRPLPRTL
jgi:hypothetical protein